MIKAAVICAVWTVTFLLLLAVGGLLSWATLRVAGHVPSQPDGRAQGGDAPKEESPERKTAASAM